MMSGLILGPQQPGNDINTYFKPVVDGLKELWQEYFGLKAILFVTVSDSLAARNLSGQSKKVGYGCLHCFRETDS
jgi:hypothetical protein